MLTMRHHMQTIIKTKENQKRRNKGANVLYKFLKKYCKELKVDPKELRSSKVVRELIVNSSQPNITSLKQLKINAFLMCYKKLSLAFHNAAMLFFLINKILVSMHWWVTIFSPKDIVVCVCVCIVESK